MTALTFATAQILRVLPRARISRAMGKLADIRWSEKLGKRVVDAYCKLYDVDIDEAAQKGGWQSFDAFFTRSLEDGARPIATDPGIMVSPSDGRLESTGTIDANRTFLVKGRPYRVEELLGDAHEAARYEGGGGCVIYLSPRDYHRVHSPVAGTVVEVRSLPGDYFPVNAIGIKHVPNLFVRNRRVAIIIENPDFGRVAVIMVVAIVVGRITVSGIPAWDVPLGVHTPNLSVEAGDEIGQFHLGSTAVCLFEPRGFDRFVAQEGPIRLGEPLVRAKSAVKTG
jgi:phosphatidylserine decarboxylase